VRIAAATIAARGAEFTRDELHGRDTVQLGDGTLAIDARNRAPVTVVIGDNSFAIANGRAEVVASGSSVVAVVVSAGAVEQTSGAAHATIAAGATWAPPPGPKTSLAAFRAGWQALHDGRNADALRAFELATDPVVVEDASFWSAVALDRAGSTSAARSRYEAFLTRFPDSTRAEAARAALARLR
jgi:Flp pilus assembly protein TadD